MLGDLGLSTQAKNDLCQALDRKDEGKIKSLTGDRCSDFIDLMNGQNINDPALGPLLDLKSRLDLSFADQGLTVRLDPFEQRGFPLPIWTKFCPLYR